MLLYIFQYIFQTDLRAVCCEPCGAPVNMVLFEGCEYASRFAKRQLGSGERLNGRKNQAVIFATLVVAKRTPETVANSVNGVLNSCSWFQQ